MCSERWYRPKIHKLLVNSNELLAEGCSRAKRYWGTKSRLNRVSGQYYHDFMSYCKKHICYILFLFCFDLLIKIEKLAKSAQEHSESKNMLSINWNELPADYCSRPKRELETRVVSVVWSCCIKRNHTSHVTLRVCEIFMQRISFIALDQNLLSSSMYRDRQKGGAVC